MKFILSILFSVSLSFAAFVHEDVWWKGETLLTFFDKHQISKDIYFNLSKTDKELCSEIYAGVLFQIMYDVDGKFEQALIPISEEMQIHIFKDITNQFTLDIIPIEFTEITQTISIPIVYSPYQDIIDNTNNKSLANEFILAFKKSVDFKKLRKNDIVSIKFKQKIRDGRYFGTPEILGASVKMRRKTYFIFQNQDDKRYYNEKGKSLTSFLLKTPLRYTRISSKFTYKRFHPILKRYRAHLGVDFAAPTGRKVYATADGKIIHKGRKGGYGKTIMIRHKNGLKSLYGHLNSYSNRIRVGSWVKQGTFIGRVGSTGRSTGPHLHFGIYKNGRAVNPLKIISVTKTKLSGKKRKDFLKYAKTIKQDLISNEKSEQKPLKIDNFEFSYKMLKG
ncbi:MAG: peptidoglycan DD-metalloendopeptidase family protein [Campylobacterota bacterium]|nr:peptidoglycan DD-metalloendopeptidase family protein [Campylobacterota bacterium]